MHRALDLLRRLRPVFFADLVAPAFFMIISCQDSIYFDVVEERSRGSKMSDPPIFRQLLPGLAAAILVVLAGTTWALVFRIRHDRTSSIDSLEVSVIKG